MRLNFVLLTLTGLAFAAHFNKWGVEQNNQVSVLTKFNFEEFIKRHKYVFVKFYAPWDGHCKAMASSYSKLAERMNNQSDGIPIAELDFTEHREIAEKYEAKSYPTLKLFIEGKAIIYQGEHEGTAIESFIREKIRPSFKTLTSADELKKLESEKKVGILVTAVIDPEQLSIFNKFSTGYDNTFYNAKFSEALAVTGSTANYNFIIYRNFDGERKVLSSDKQLSLEELQAFWKANKNPTLMEFDKETGEMIFDGQEETIFLFTDSEFSDAIKIFAQVAKDKQGVVNFCKSTIRAGFGKRLSEYLDITEADENTVVLVTFKNGNPDKYKLAQWDQSILSKFVDDFGVGGLKPLLKSEPIPETNSDPVKVIVGNNFESMILNSNKHVLLMIYAPWCAHCNLLFPIYEELAKMLAENEDIIIAKMDGTKNDNPLASMKYYPTIMFFTKGDSLNPIDYREEKTIKGFLGFLEKTIGKKVLQSSAFRNKDIIVEIS